MAAELARLGDIESDLRRAAAAHAAAQFDAVAARAAPAAEPLDNVLLRLIGAATAAALGFALPTDALEYLRRDGPPTAVQPHRWARSVTVDALCTALRRVENAHGDLGAASGTLRAATRDELATIDVVRRIELSTEGVSLLTRSPSCYPRVLIRAPCRRRRGIAVEIKNRGVA